ncbi:tetratricopeptide repeat protein [Streptosporangium sp. CA-135522]|uniref:AfsR/SARP family transcriptional regulator n=1 Tax=Streptosporangium sp. CA-135522 TaxID=3240072 RepID=UPI003D92E4F3
MRSAPCGGMMNVRFAVLGPVTVSAAGRPVPAAAPRRQAVLAYLLLHPRTVISADRLIGAMWGVTPPDTARAQLQSAIAAIRQVLRTAGAGEILQTRTAGYILLTEPDQVDLEVFTRQVAAPDADAEQLRAALALWQGEPLAGLTADFVDQARTRLQQRRLAVVERLVELELAMGRHAELVDTLTAELAEHPLRERLCGQLMLALYRSGLQTDGLNVARSFRERLADQQGLDPSRSFLALEQSILRADQSLSPPARQAPEPVAVAVAEPATRRPASFLPMDIPDFAGRPGELDWIIDSLSENGGIVTIDGMAGIGKTTLAVRAAHRLAEHYPDGQLFIDLHAHTVGQARVEPDAVLETLLRQLGIPPERLPAGTVELSALWRAELTHRRLLVVVDNAGDADHVRPLLSGASRSLVLVTSRRRMVDLDGAHTLSMEVLPAEDASALFTSIVGERALAEPISVLDVLQLCGFLPLAVRIAAARLRHRPRWTVTYLADRLRDQRRRLAELSTAERGVAAAFTLSYQQLNPDQQRMFRLLGLHPGVDADVHAAAVLADLPPERGEEILEDLLDTHMLMQHEIGRYTFHDLLREQARRTVADEESTETRNTALTRLLDHYLHTAAAAMDLLYPDGRHHRPRFAEPKELPFADPAGATAWLDAERANLIRAGVHAADADWPAHAVGIAQTFHRFLVERTHYGDALTINAAAARASRRLGDVSAEGLAFSYLGDVHWPQGDYAEADECFTRAVERFREAGDQSGEANALNNLAGIHMSLGDHERARSSYTRCLEVYHRYGERVGEAVALSNLGLLEVELGNYHQALEYLQEALAIARNVGYLALEAHCMACLGGAYQGMGDFRRALDHYGQALEVYRDLGNRYRESEVLSQLGETVRTMGDPAQAATDLQAALTIADEIANRPRQAAAHHGLTRAHRDLGQDDLARTHAARALDLFADLGVPDAQQDRHPGHRAFSICGAVISVEGASR